MALVGLVVSLASGPAQAEDAALGVELNKLEPLDGACRAYLLIANEGAAALDRYVLDLVIFDAEGIIQDRLAVDIGPLRAGKTSVKAFDVREMACGSISRFLMNGVIECTSDADGCAIPLAVSARTGASFID